MFWFCGQFLPVVDSVLHLGNALHFDLSDKLDVQRKLMAFIRQANSVLYCFRATDPLTKMRLFHAYCLSLYGCSLRRLDCPALRSLGVTFNQVIRRIWHLPRNCHTAIVHSVGLISSIFNIVLARFSKFFSSAVSHSSPLVRSVFVVSSQSCNSHFIGIMFCSVVVTASPTLLMMPWVNLLEKFAAHTITSRISVFLS